MAPKRTIDRRRRPKGTTLPAAKPKKDDTDDDDSSVEISPSKQPPAAADESDDSDSSADEATPRKKASAAKKQEQHNDSDDDDEELHSDSSEVEEARALQDSSANDDEDSSEEEEPPAKKKKLARSKAAPKRKPLSTKKRQAPSKPKRGTKTKAPASDDEEEEVEEESESDGGKESNVSDFNPDKEDEQSDDESEESWDDDKEKKPRAKRGRPKKAAARGKRQSTRTPARGRGASRRSSKKQDSDSEDSWNSSDSEEEDERKTARSYKTPRGTRRSSRVARRQSSSEEEEEDEEDDSHRRSTPSRRSAARALKRISDNVGKDEKDENDDDDEEETGDLFGSANKRRKKKNDDDEEFDPDADEEEQDDSDDDELGEESSADGDNGDRDDKQYEAGNVDAQQDFLTADSSEDENAPVRSPMLDIKRTPASRSRSRQRPVITKDSDSFASADSDQDESDQEQQGPALSCSPHMPDCPSKVDTITLDPLPAKHLCFFPPDQQSRQCFALETLHKIAITSSVRGVDGKPTFLQPPHFRAPASDDFVDQIASRFGRSALDLSGDFYKRGMLGDTDGYMLTFGDNLRDEETFQERLNNYVSNCMGSQDICCCPLCYIEAHRRLVKRLSGEEEEDFADEQDDAPEEDDPEEAGEDEHGPIKLWHDPMTVLGFPDNEKYAIASNFCYSKMADVKRHLREAHNVDTSVLASNDMFARFKIRAGDGLLQRYIDGARRGRTYQGDMRRYWNLGNNQTFVFLIHLLKRRVVLKEMLDAGSDVNGEASTLFDNAQEYYQSFQNRAKRTWETVSAPYRKATKEELNEFIEEGDVEEEDDPQPHFAMKRELDMNPEDEIVEALKMRRRLSQGRDQESESEDSSVEVVENAAAAHNDEDGSEETETPNGIPGYYSEEEEEDDEWVTSRLARPGRRKKDSPASRPGKRLGKASRDKKKRDGQLKRDPDSQDSGAQPPAGKKAKRIIVDSDSDE